jgi:hypothetical protein
MPQEGCSGRARGGKTALAVEDNDGIAERLDDRTQAFLLVYHPFTTRSPLVSPAGPARTR